MQVNHLGGLGLAQGQNGAMRPLKKTNRALRKILERLSTAQRINRASDDAAGLGVSEQLRTQIRGFKMASRNVADATSAVNIAEGAANEVSGMIQRQRELAVQARNDTLTDDQRRALDVEYQQLTAEITRISDATQFNRQDVASGDDLADGNASIQVGPNAGDEITLPSVDMNAATLGIEGQSIATSVGAEQALQAADSALDSLNSQRTTLGATVNRFESVTNNLAVAEINTQAAESVLRDLDMARGLADLVRNQLLQEGATRSLGRFNEISANHLLGLIP
ncbi:MAG: flagellin [Chitinivibrionales bacterium]|nr:flagellin [Chitinivibrionales bacterium]